MITTNKFSIEIKNKEHPPRVDVMQGDEYTRAVEVTLVDNKVPWEIPAGVSAAVAFLKPDGKKGLYDTLPDGSSACSISGSKVTAILAPESMTAAGVAKVAIVLTDKNTLRQLTTFTFLLNVWDNPSAGQKISNNYYKYSTMEEVSNVVEAALSALEEDKQAFLAEASEALSVVHDAMTEDAPAIVCEASGEGITVADASNRVLHGLTLYGKTTQNGIPALESPVPLESVGDSGSVDVFVSGKNLLNPAEFEQGAVNSLTVVVNEDGTVDISGQTTQTATVDVDLKSVNAQFAVGTYTLSGCPSGGSSNTYKLYAKIQKANGTTDYVNDIGNGGSFTIGSGDIVDKLTLRFGPGYAITGTLHFKPQLEIGSAATEYEPYKGGVLTVSTPTGLRGIPVSSGGNYTDADGQQWICDEVDFARGVYVKRIQRIVFDGTQQITVNGANIYFSYQVMDMSNNTKSQCSHLRHSGTLTTEIPMYRVTYNTNAKAGYISFTGFINTGIATTVDEMKTCLSNNPITVDYILAEPIETALTAEELAQYAALHTNKPYTTVYNDSGAHMALEYVADTKTYIDQKLAAISAAMLNV